MVYHKKMYNDSGELKPTSALEEWLEHVSITDKEIREALHVGDELYETFRKARIIDPSILFMTFNAKSYA